MRKFTGADAWTKAFDYIREANRPDIVKVDGHSWKVYPSGRVLCAASRPYHDALLDDGTCDCLTRTGKTIATYRWPMGDLLDEEA